MATQIVDLLLKEINMEAGTTRKMLALVPDDKFDWKPHEKSMSFRQLAVHLAEIPGWITMAIQEDVLDFAGGYKPTHAETAHDLLRIFDENYASGRAALSETNDEFILNNTWTMKMGEQVLMTLTKYETIRHAISQNIHHRAQLGVFLRLNNIAIPGTYGPSADDMGKF
ncbi:MAG: DinB family protein [Chitinophagaceae bacterium]